MTIQAVLLPVFVLIGLTFALLLGMVGSRRGAVARGEVKGDVSLRQPNWPDRTMQVSNAFSNQFELPILFYILIAIAWPLRHADLVIVCLSWVFVVTRFAHAGVFVTSNHRPYRSMAWRAGAIVLFVMWVYFALKILLLI
jgi:hypothetical protein